MTSRARHIDIKHHFILDVTNRGDVEMKYIPTEDNPADMMTKMLHKHKFAKFKAMLKGPQEP